MQLVPRELVGSAERSDMLAERALLALQALDLASPGAERNKKLFNESGNRRIPFRRDHAGLPVNLVVK